MSFDAERRIFDKEYRSWEIDLSSFQPLHSGVLLERVDLPESKVVLTDRVPIHRGRVLRVGPGKRREDGSRLPVNVKPGQIVQYHSCDVDSGTHVLIEEADILFIEGVQI